MGAVILLTIGLFAALGIIFMFLFPLTMSNDSKKIDKRDHNLHV